MKPSIKLMKPSFYLTNQVDFRLMIAELVQELSGHKEGSPQLSEIATLYE